MYRKSDPRAMDQVFLPDSHADVAELLASRRAKASVPDGYRDTSGRWWPSKQEEAVCCQHIRRPSQAWPNSLRRHCCTRQHLEHLAAVREQMHRFAGKLTERAVSLGFEAEAALRLLDEQAEHEGLEDFEHAMKHAAHRMAKQERQAARRQKMEAYYARQRARELDLFVAEFEADRVRWRADNPGWCEPEMVAKDTAYLAEMRALGRPPKGWSPFQRQQTARLVDRAAKRAAAREQALARLTPKGERAAQAAVPDPKQTQ